MHAANLFHHGTAHKSLREAAPTVPGAANGRNQSPPRRRHHRPAVADPPLLVGREMSPNRHDMPLGMGRQCCFNELGIIQVVCISGSLRAPGNLLTNPLLFPLLSAASHGHLTEQSVSPTQQGECSRRMSAHVGVCLQEGGESPKSKAPKTRSVGLGLGPVSISTLRCCGGKTGPRRASLTCSSSWAA